MDLCHLNRPSNKTITHLVKKKKEKKNPNVSDPFKTCSSRAGDCVGANIGLLKAGQLLKVDLKLTAICSTE